MPWKPAKPMRFPTQRSSKPPQKKQRSTKQPPTKRSPKMRYRHLQNIRSTSRAPKAPRCTPQVKHSFSLQSSSRQLRPLAQPARTYEQTTDVCAMSGPPIATQRPPTDRASAERVGFFRVDCKSARSANALALSADEAFARAHGKLLQTRQVGHSGSACA